ncbi:hypothetical protein AAKU52_002350 [Pedobacter sp. CG_S7]|uniref:DUF2971 domain-containing protein n=1 Tax=Pedobacter sp. CG_S7 TaxID=3143930 RepID=UPI003392C135
MKIQFIFLKPDEIDKPISKIAIVNGLYLKSQLGKSIFCQSWSFTKESDAMWRVYSQGKNSVNISTTPRKLFISLFEIDNDIQKVFIGKVKYVKSLELKTLYRNNAENWIFQERGLGICKSLLYKRYPFKHENEVRLIYNTFLNAEKPILKYDFDPLEVFENIVFDPRIEYSQFMSRKEQLKKLGFKKPIIKSNLYKLPIYNTIK